jgi:hypothetical protein
VTTAVGAIVAAWQAADTTMNVPVQKGMVHIHPSWPPVLLGGLSGGAIAYVVIWAVLLFRHLYSYHHSGYQDESWFAAAIMAGNLAMFTLSLKPGAVPETFMEHGHMLCVVRGPTGEVQTFSDKDSQILSRGSQDVFAQWRQTTPRPGNYEIRWYGSHNNKGHYYEITRTTVPLPSESPPEAQER